LGNGRRPKLLITTQAGRDQLGLTNQEIEELTRFCFRDGRENAMDVSGVDGFLCACYRGRMSSCLRVDAVGLGFCGSKKSPEFRAEAGRNGILDLLLAQRTILPITFDRGPQYMSRF